MAGQPTVPIQYVNYMLAMAKQRNCDIDALLIAIGGSREQLNELHHVPVLFYGELYHHIIQQVSDEWFGLLSTGEVQPGTLRLLCQTTVHCRTLAHAIERSAEFFKIARGFIANQSLSVIGDQALCRLKKIDCVDDVAFQATISDSPASVIKSSLLAWHGFGCWLTGQDIAIQNIYYSFSESEDSHYRNAENTFYNQEFNGYSFDVNCLDYPIIQNEENIEDFIRKAPYYSFMGNREESLAQRIKSLLVRNSGNTYPTAQEVADVLNMSVQTLHRHLSKEDTSYQSLKDEYRTEAAIHYLNCQDMSNESISELLGFENPSTFYRSFKKWTGISPGEYRKQRRDKS
ncbi:MAG: helix-turn-helix domain-containing protein [Pseudomonadales bacterium]